MLLLALAGCDDGAPPLDQLPLRDALRADPAVMATLPDDARQRLATRLEAARTSDDTSDSVAGDPGATQPAVLMTEADAARAQRSGDALIVGAIASGTARALPDVSTGTTAPLPPLEIEATAPPLTAIESRALHGNAAAVLRGLLAASGAHHLRRVVGWPTGAVAIGDTVYVGGAWLAALAPAMSADGGADAGAPAPSGDTTTADGVAANAAAPGAAPASDERGSPDAGAGRATPATENVGAPYNGYDGGVIVVYPPSTPQPTPPTSTDDSCGAAADSCAACGAASTDDSDSCDSTSDGGDDSCDSTSSDGSDDSCNSTSDSSDDSCNNTSSDSYGDDTNCQVSRGSRRHGGTSPSMMLSLFAPLAFLLSRRRQ